MLPCADSAEHGSTYAHWTSELDKTKGSTTFTFILVIKNFNLITKFDTNN